MNKATIILAIALAAILSACTSAKTTLADRRAEISWSTFCAVRCYDTADTTSQAANEYLDTWRGSVEEEDALINAGVKLY